MNHTNKVTPDHFRRDAYLYIRRAMVHQKAAKSTLQRQYALREKATTLGWPTERVIVIDCDVGQSGASTQQREGFQRLISDVRDGRVGILLTLQASRLSRNCGDWHRLLETCAFRGTLLLVNDEVYNPAHVNDRLLLGLGSEGESNLFHHPSHLYDREVY